MTLLFSFSQWTPLHESARNGRLEVARLLVESTADVAARSRCFSPPPSHHLSLTICLAAMVGLHSNWPSTKRKPTLLHTCAASARLNDAPPRAAAAPIKAVLVRVAAAAGLHCISLFAKAALKLPVFWSSRKLTSLRGAGASALPPLTIVDSLSALQRWHHCTQMRHRLQQSRGCCIPAQHRRAAMTRIPRAAAAQIKAVLVRVAAAVWGGRGGRSCKKI